MPFYSSDSFDRHVISTEYKFIFWPKPCHISNKVLWLEFAYRKTAMWTGPGEPLYEYRWYNKKDYLFYML